MIMISYMDMLDLSKDECGLYLENVYKKAMIWNFFFCFINLWFYGQYD